MPKTRRHPHVEVETHVARGKVADLFLYLVQGLASDMRDSARCLVPATFDLVFEVLDCILQVISNPACCDVGGVIQLRVRPQGSIRAYGRRESVVRAIMKTAEAVSSCIDDTYCAK